MNGKVLKIIDSKTAKVECVEYKKHPIYAKYITSKRRYLVDTKDIEVKVGDEVLIISCKPVSKRKSWAVKNIIKQNS